MASSKRILKELEAYHRDPSPALVSLEPAEEDNLTEFRAVLRGPDGTAYEGMYSLFLNPHFIARASLLIIYETKNLQAASSPSPSQLHPPIPLNRQQFSSQRPAAIQTSVPKQERSVSIYSKPLGRLRTDSSVRSRLCSSCSRLGASPIVR